MTDLFRILLSVSIVSDVFDAANRMLITEIDKKHIRFAER